MIEFTAIRLKLASEYLSQVSVIRIGTFEECVEACRKAATEFESEEDPEPIHEETNPEDETFLLEYGESVFMVKKIGD